MKSAIGVGLPTVVAVLLAVLPTALVRWLANLAGHKIAPGARIGLSLVRSRNICLAPGTRIGHFNLIRNGRLLMHEGAYIGNFNVIRGPVDIWMARRAAIGNRNQVTRAPRGVTYGPAQLKLGELSKITASHKIDCANSVLIGDFTTIAGAGTQVWTHGYVHAKNGAGRYRVDGRVRLGNNVYIGSRAMITGGVTIAPQIIVGAGATVGKSLDAPGMYVPGALRHLPAPGDPRLRSDLEPVSAPNLVETVYRKRD